MYEGRKTDLFSLNRPHNEDCLMIRTSPLSDIEHLRGFADAYRPIAASTVARELSRLPARMHPVQKTEHVKTELLIAAERVLLPCGPVTNDDNGVDGNRETTSLHVPVALGLVEAIMVNAGCFKDSRSFAMRQGTSTRSDDETQRTIMEEGVELDEDTDELQTFMLAMEFKRKVGGDDLVSSTSADIRLIGGRYIKRDRLFRFTHEIHIHTARYGDEDNGFDPGDAKGVPPPGRRI